MRYKNKKRRKKKEFSFKNRIIEKEKFLLPTEAMSLVEIIFKN